MLMATPRTYCARRSRLRMRNSELFAVTLATVEIALQLRRRQFPHNAEQSSTPTVPPFLFDTPS
jgi:hypothetical protein